MMTWLWWGFLGVAAAWVIVMFCMVLGLRMPFATRRRERGEPICGHPFEMTWRRGPGGKLIYSTDRWMCPKCWTWFERRDGRWRMVR